MAHGYQDKQSRGSIRAPMCFLILITVSAGRKEKRRRQQHLGVQAQSNQSLVREEIRLTAYHRRDLFNCITVTLCCNLHIRAYSFPSPHSFPTLRDWEINTCRQERSGNKREMKEHPISTVYGFIWKEAIFYKEFAKLLSHRQGRAEGAQGWLSG